MRLVQYKSHDGTELALFEFDDITTYDEIGECFVDAERHVKELEKVNETDEFSPLDLIEQYLAAKYDVFRSYIYSTVYSEYL